MENGHPLTPRQNVCACADFGDKGTELEMEVRSRLSDKSTSSQEQNADQSDSSLSDEADTITKTQTIRLTEIGTRRRKNAMFTPEKDKYLSKNWT